MCNSLPNLPLVSVVISSYNYQHHIASAIDSVLKQSYQPIEIIVVDDGSVDNSPQIIKGYGEKVIPILKINGGQSSALNAGFLASCGEIVCFLDSDDFYAADKIKKIVEVFLAHPEIGWCFHPLRYINEIDEFIAIYPPPPDNCHLEVEFRNQVINNAKRPPWGPPTSGLCFRRSLLAEILPIPESLTHSMDGYLRNASVSLVKGFFFNEPLSIMRIHGSNARYILANPKIFLIEAYWLRENFPHLRKLANKIFTWGFGRVWRERSVEPICKETIAHYLSKSSFLEKIEIFLRTGYHFMRSFVVSTKA